MYTCGMDAKERYRQREKLRRLLSRVQLALFRCQSAGIAADLQTARHAARLVVILNRYCHDAGLTTEEIVTTKSTVTLERTLKGIKRESRARMRRAKRTTPRPNKGAGGS